MRKIVFTTVVLFLCFFYKTHANAFDVPVIEPGSYIKFTKKSGRTNNYTINFYENNRCSYSWWDLWTTTETDCSWVQNGPEVEIRMGKGGMRARFISSGSGYMNAWAGDAHWSGFLENYRYVWKDWKSPEEKRRIAEEKRRREEEKRVQEEQRLAQIKTDQEKFSKPLSGREYAKEALKQKTSTVFTTIIFGGILGLIGSLIGGSVGGVIGVILGLLLSKLIHGQL